MPTRPLRRTLPVRRLGPGLFLVLCAGLIGNLFGQSAGSDAKSAGSKTAMPKSTSARSVGAGAKAAARRVTPRKVDNAPQLKEYRTQNFLVITDLDDERAHEQLERLEGMLAIVVKYFGRGINTTIPCYIVDDLKNWPDGLLDPRGKESVEGGGGLTMGETIVNGDRFIARTVVYAAAHRGVPTHEAVHAYCITAFGTAGPVWYAEGMAEIGQYWVKGDEYAVHCHDFVRDYLKSQPPKNLLEIVDSEERTGDSWENYAWRWALCHMLAYNTNYSLRFKPLGLGLLTRQDTSFEQVYGPMAKEVTFEYEFFLKHFDIGYRVDLCSWDWKTKCAPLRGSGSAVCRINARNGWQCSRVSAEEGTEFDVAVEGTWRTAPDREFVSAQGHADGRGKLLGVIQADDYSLSEPFEIPAYGTFKAPSTGKLYLRCGDAWHEIADNEGKVNVRIKLTGKGLPLPRPKALDAPAAGGKPQPAKPDAD